MKEETEMKEEIKIMKEEIKNGIENNERRSAVMKLKKLIVSMKTREKMNMKIKTIGIIKMKMIKKKKIIKDNANDEMKC